MPVDLTDAAYIEQDGYPLLRIRVNGCKALLEPARKPLLHECGLVFIGDDLDLPQIFIKPEDGGWTRLKNFTNDARLFSLFDQFSRAAGDGTLKYGPVDIPAEPVTRAAIFAEQPHKLRTSIGGYTGRSYGVELVDGLIRYGILGEGFEPQSQEWICPTPAAWKAFRNSLDEIGVWKWKRRYENAEIRDGTQWGLEIEYADRQIDSSGSNAGPPKPKRGQKEHPLPLYLQAVSKLIGGKEFV